MKGLVRAVVAIAALLVAASAQAQTAKAKPSVVSGINRTSKEDVNRRNADGSTPLQWAVYNGDVTAARRLLRAGANVALANN